METPQSSGEERYQLSLSGIKPIVEPIVFPSVSERIPSILKKIPMEIQEDISFWDSIGMIWKVVKKMPTIIWLLYQLVTLADGVKNMTIDKKTTIATVVAIVATICGLFGKTMAPELQATITDAIYIVWGAVIALIGWFTGKPEKE